MKEQVNFGGFCDRFGDMNRADNFSYEGKRALFDWLEDYEESCDPEGFEIELDVIALCCEYTEYKNLEEFQKDYGKEYASLEDIQYKTTVIGLEGEGFIIQQF